MADFLNEFIRSSGGGVRSISNILNEVKGQQRSIEEVLKLLVNRERFASLSIPRYKENRKIESANINAGFRDTTRYLRNLFVDSGDIDFLLESMERGIGSDIKRIEDELSSLEKMLDLFAFFLADGKKFDGFFIETFSDNVMQNADLNIQFSDRDSLPLSAEHFVHVDPDAGIAIRGSGNPHKYLPIVLADAQINHFPVAKYELDLGPASLGVMARVESDSIVTNKVMPEFIKVGSSEKFHDPNVTLRETEKGLVMRLRYHTPSPTFAQLVKIQPLSNNAVELNQVFLYETESLSNKIPLLDKPRKLTTSQTISFEGRILTGIEIVLRQPEYKREVFTVTRPRAQSSFNLDEVGRRVVKNYRDGIINLRNPAFRKPESWSKDFTFSRNAEDNNKYLTRMLYKSNGRRTSLKPNVSKEVTELLKRIQGGNKELFKYSGVGSHSENPEMRNKFENLEVRKLIKNRVKKLRGMDFSEVFDGENASLVPDSEIQLASQNDPEAVEMEETQILKYVYEIGIAGIDLGTGAIQSKAVYVSKPISMNGDPGIVRISTIDSRSITLDKLRDSKYLDSIEYSVSNSSFPSSEADWHPILPDRQRVVQAERLFFDSSGRAHFRFEALMDEEVNIYENGELLQLELDNYLFRNKSDSAYAGITLPRNHFSSDSFVTVDYVPVPGCNEVDFSTDPEFNKVPLTYSSSRQGRGEHIKAIAGRREYQLSNEPYIEKELIRNAEYDPSSGLSYKPITIVFDNGQGAINLTNYQGGIQSKLNITAPEYQYLQSGPVITFNKVPESDFKVIYRYIPSRLRVRAILRCDSPQFSSSTIDLIQVKAKTRHSDIRKI